MMDPDIQDCIELLRGEYDRASDMSIVFSPQWRKILQNPRIALWGKSEAEETVNLGLPSYKQFLFRLAEQGLGYTDGIRSYEFIFLRGRTFHAFQVFSLLMAKQFLLIVIPQRKTLTCRHQPKENSDVY
jgi:hypothetical protein